MTWCSPALHSHWDGSPISDTLLTNGCIEYAGCVFGDSSSKRKSNWFVLPKNKEFAIAMGSRVAGICFSVAHIAPDPSAKQCHVTIKWGASQMTLVIDQTFFGIVLNHRLDTIVIRPGAHARLCDIQIYLAPDDLPVVKENAVHSTDSKTSSDKVLAASVLSTATAEVHPMMSTSVYKTCLQLLDKEIKALSNPNEARALQEKCHGLRVVLLQLELLCLLGNESWPNKSAPQTDDAMSTGNVIATASASTSSK